MVYFFQRYNLDGRQSVASVGYPPSLSGFTKAPYNPRVTPLTVSDRYIPSLQLSSFTKQLTSPFKLDSDVSRFVATKPNTSWYNSSLDHTGRVPVRLLFIRGLIL